jgi:ribosomal protein S4
LKKAKRQFGAALVKLVKKDPDFAAALLSMLKARLQMAVSKGQGLS